MARFAFDVNQSPVCGNNAADCGKSQAGTLASTLGGEKRLEEVLTCFASMPQPLSETTSRTQGKAPSPRRAAPAWIR